MDNEEQVSGSPVILSEIAKRDFRLASKIVPHLNSSLESYLKGIFAAPLKETNSDFDKLVEAMHIYLQKNGQPIIENLYELLSASPCIQQADHSNLLLDKETFFNNLLHAESARLNGCDYIFTSQCSIVSCITRRTPIFGPVFLNYNDGVYKLFDKSKRSLKDANFCTVDAPITFDITGMESPIPLTDEFLQHLNRKTFETPEKAFLYANDYIWNKISYAKDVRRIAFDESLISELAVLHLRDVNSPLYKLIFDENVRSNFIKTKRNYIAKNTNSVISSPYPDFFWLRKSNKLRSLKCDANELNFTILETGEACEIQKSPEGVINLLTAGELYMDRMMAYFLRCLLPNIVAIGGTSQQDYLAAYQEIFLLADAKVPFLNDNQRLNIANQDLSQFGGAPLIEEVADYFQDIALIDFKEKIEMNKPRKLSKTIGEFRCAGYLLQR